MFTLRRALVLTLVLLAVAPVYMVTGGEARRPGVVSNIKVISDKVEDVTTLEDRKRSYIRDGMSDREKAIAIWKTVVKYRHQVKLVGRQQNTACIFDMRIDADYREPAGGFRPVRITYVWEEGGAARRDVHIATKPKDTYTIRCGAKPLMKSILLELAE